MTIGAASNGFPSLPRLVTFGSGCTALLGAPW
jgi:hypothetical protein